MNVKEKSLYRKLAAGSDSLDPVVGGTQSKSTVGAINQIVGNPAFKAEITLQAFVRYYSQAVVGTPVVAVPPAGQQTNLPLYLFGNTDRAANYAKSRQLVPAGAGWTYGDMKVITCGSGEVDFKPLPHAAAAVDYASGTIFNNLAQAGDLLFIIPMAGFVAGAAATTVSAEILIRCPNVPYSTFLASLNSDKIELNMIRYVVPAAAVAQLGQQITFIKQSLFGKTSTDTLDPQTFVTPGTFQPQIADIPITVPIDKNFVAATEIQYTAAVPVALTWTLTVSGINKL
jgi:hypothetical protein